MASSPELLSGRLDTYHTTGATYPHKLGRACSKMPWRSSWFEVKSPKATRFFSSPRSPMGGEQRPLVFHCRPLHFEAIMLKFFHFYFFLSFRN